jgi:sensor histidine kinase YesM
MSLLKKELGREGVSMSPFTIVLLVLVGFIVLYIMFRLVSKAILRSYYEEKTRQQNLEKGENYYGKKV